MIELKSIELEKMLSIIIEDIEEWLIITNLNKEIVYINKYVEKLSGYSKEEILGDKAENLWEMQKSPILDERLEGIVKTGQKFNSITENKSKYGKPFYLAMSVIGVKEQEGIGYYIWIGKDITTNKLMQDTIYKIKYRDELTDLPNQKAFLEGIEQKIAVETEESFGVILFDVNKMNYINNTYGYTEGDLVLKEVGHRIEKELYRGYHIAKLNADVFAVRVDGEAGIEKIELFLEGVAEAMNTPIELHTGEVYVELRAGIAIYPMQAKSMRELLNKAQIALAKVNRYNKEAFYSIYQNYMQEEVKERMVLESEMHRAYENNEFIVYYQPFIDLQSQNLIGMEALLRRRKGNGELVLPGKFISLLEEMELISQVGMGVVRSVCQQLRNWIEEGYEVVPISINLSSVQFRNKHLVKEIMGVLEDYDIAPNLLILEVTETVIMEDVDVARDMLKELRLNGFSIAIDDFGIGYSSLNYLKKFIFDHLKIDISFIREISHTQADRAIVAAIIDIAKALNLKTVAEGIESLEQLELIKEMGCEIGQGFLWDAPMSAEELEEKYLEKYGTSMLH